MPRALPVGLHFAVDDNLLYEILHEGPKDLEKFLQDFSNFLKKTKTA